MAYAFLLKENIELTKLNTLKPRKATISSTLLIRFKGTFKSLYLANLAPLISPTRGFVGGSGAHSY